MDHELQTITPKPETMRSQILLPLLAILTPAFAQNGVAAGGGLFGTAAAVQYPVVSQVASLLTVGGTTTVKTVAFTQTFAATPLGTWDLGATPLSGVIGLGDIKGTVGAVKEGEGS